jgi:hypothetical protein
MIKFLEKEHKYYTEDDRELISVSARVHKLEPVKDWDAIAKKYAKKHGESAQYWIDKWEEKKNKSAEIGTIFHAMKEQEVIDNGFEGLQVKLCTHINGVKWSIPIQKLSNNTIYPELMIYDMDSMTCGQSDKVVVKNNKISILDFKTDKEILFKSYSSEWVKPEKLLAPCNHLDNCNGVLYSLKMSMYMYMLWKQNPHLRIGDIIIEHVTLKRDEEGIPVLENGKPVVLGIKPIKLPYRKEEVKRILYDTQNI